MEIKRDYSVYGVTTETLLASMAEHVSTKYMRVLINYLTVLKETGRTAQSVLDEYKETLEYVALSDPGMQVFFDFMLKIGQNFEADLKAGLVPGIGRDLDNQEE